MSPHAVPAASEDERRAWRPRPVAAVEPRPRGEDDDRRFVSAGYRELFAAGPEIEPHLRGVVEDSLERPGRLFRAHLAFAVQRACGIDREPARKLAIGIEYFHTASLLFDDMPAMDDATERRGHACAHLRHGEGAATLGALAFIARGYALLWEIIGELPPERRQSASEMVAECVGLAGVLDGQSRDIHYSESDRGGDAVLRVATGKTVSMLRLALILPAIVGGAPCPTLARLEALSRLWGLGYQTVDDFKDCLMSAVETGKTSARDAALDHPNLPRAIGFAAASAVLDQLLAASSEQVAHLTADGERWKDLQRLQHMLEAERAALRRQAHADPETGLGADRGHARR